MNAVVEGVRGGGREKKKNNAESDSHLPINLNALYKSTVYVS